MRCARFVAILTLSASLANAQTLTRQQAVSAVLGPGSGLTITTNSAVWSPYVDFGAGLGFEGLLAAGSAVQPAFPVADPYPASTANMGRDMYFFWVDDDPAAWFTHPTRFVLVDATNPAPTVANGGIESTSQGWWPVIVSGGSTNTFFAALDDRASAAPAGYDNPEGHIAGPVTLPDDLLDAAEDTAGDAAPIPAGAPPNNACGLVVMGPAVDDAAFRATRDRMRDDLFHHYNIPSERIILANNGSGASFADFQQAISDICDLVPPCDKIYVRIATHGGTGSLVFKDESVSQWRICREFRKLAAKRVPVCVFIAACHSGSLLTSDNWDLWPGSSVITSANSTNVSYAGAWQEGKGSLGYVAFSNCLNTDPAGAPGLDRNGDGNVDEGEAYQWVLDTKPCLNWPPTGKMYYPVGAPEGVTPDTLVPGMSGRTVGPHPFAVTVNARNVTGFDKTDFHVVLAGNVSNLVVKSAWKSDADGNAGDSFDTSGDVTYDPNANETWVDFFTLETLIASQDYIQIRLVQPEGGLKVLRQFWTPTNTPSWQGNWVPAGEGERGRVRAWSDFSTNGYAGGAVLSPITNTLVRTNFHMRFDARLATTNGPSGWGAPMAVENKVHYSKESVPPEEMRPGSPALSNATSFGFGYYDVYPGKPLYLALDTPPRGTSTILFESHMFWGENGNDSRIIQQFGWGPRMHIGSVPDYAVVVYPQWAKAMTLEKNAGDLQYGAWDPVEGAFFFETPDYLLYYIHTTEDSCAFRLRER